MRVKFLMELMRALYFYLVFLILQVTNYRFSIAWTRIYPTGTGSTPNQAGVDFYNNFIDSLIVMGIEPLVTLYHWDLPQGLEDHGGWLNRSTADAYAEYADTCFRLFGDRVRFENKVIRDHLRDS